MGTPSALQALGHAMLMDKVVQTHCQRLERWRARVVYALCWVLLILNYSRTDTMHATFIGRLFGSSTVPGGSNREKVYVGPESIALIGSVCQGCP